ncbi:hypothetical protein PG985_015446 [Apiospora marii]|uniref:Dpy-30 domain-containing protein n=1 Tax=Apiospora marii TaxID=335849 RepID=A0ABR1S5I6_9PEZI
MAEENRRISTTPIPVPMPFGQLAAAAPAPSPLSQTTPIASTPAEAPSTTAAVAAAQTAPAPSTEPIVEGVKQDVAMTDVPTTTEQAPSPAPVAMPATSGASPAPPARTGTPLRTNGQPESNSRATSQHPDTGFTMPAEAPPHGAPVRQYLNTNVTGALLEGMKQLAKEQPKDPLRVLGEFLLQRSKEVEQST